MIEETLAALVDRFNRHAERTPALGEELRGIERTIAIRLSDGPSYAVDLKDGRLSNLRTADHVPANVTIRTDSKTFQSLVTKDLGPMKAIVTRRLTIDGSLEDKLLFRKLL